MYDLLVELFPLHRSLTGEGVRHTLAILQQRLPGLEKRSVASGTPCFDWTIPREWNVRDAYVLDADGRKIIDIDKCNLHLVAYSVPVDREMELEELQQHLHSKPEQPDAIPFVSSYYEEQWGFCLSQHQRDGLRPGRYRVHIDSTLEAGQLDYGEFVLPGESPEEIFLSTYICHPSLANNELSGPVVTLFLANWLRSLPFRRYSYRIVFMPETIGAIYYVSRHLNHLKERVVAGFNITCVGDDRCHSFLPSRRGGTLADRVALHVLNHWAADFKQYDFLDRGSDERQYCAPGVDLPMVSMMRSKYATYPEYHTSLDNLELVTVDGLSGGYEALRLALSCLEGNERLRVNVLCEPQLGRRGLYPNTSARPKRGATRILKNLLAFLDGEMDLLAVAERIGVPMWDLLPMVERLKNEGLVGPADES